MTREEFSRYKEYIKCPQFGDKEYGKYGSLNYSTRLEIKKLIDHCEVLHDFEDQVTEFLYKKLTIVGSPKKVGIISRSDYDFFFKNLFNIDELIVYDDSVD